MARSRTFARPGRKIDHKSWAAAPGLILESAVDGTNISGGLSFTIPATLLRFRGYVSAMFDETAQAGDLMVLTYGVCIISTDAFNVGATAVPDPADEPEFPWIWWGEMRLNSFGVLTDTRTGWGPAAQRIEVDSKAMRKIKPGETVTTVIQRSNTAGAPVTLVDIGQLRMLIGT